MLKQHGFPFMVACFLHNSGQKSHQPRPLRSQALPKQANFNEAPVSFEAQSLSLISGKTSKNVKKIVGDVDLLVASVKSKYRSCLGSHSK